MKKSGITCFLALVFYLSSLPARSQDFDIGLAFGISGFYGDLGGANYIGRPLFFDLEKSLVRPAVTAHFRKYMNKRVAVSGSLLFTRVAGDDKLIQPKDIFAPEWFRWYRNLNFRTTIIEASVNVEVNLMRFEPGSMRYRVAPYMFAGLGIFHFNPKTVYLGQVIDLKPLHTEGEGFPDSHVKEYSLTQPVIPLGIGIRYNLTQSLILTFDYRDCFSFTDYIDDVSGIYTSQTDFSSYFSDPATAQLAYDISVRSDELDPEGIFARVTSAGVQRGDPKQNDNYVITQISISYLFGGPRLYGKKQTRCVHW